MAEEKPQKSKRREGETAMEYMRRICEERGIPFRDVTQPGRRGIIFYGSASRGKKGPKE